MYSFWWMELLDLLNDIPTIKSSLTIFDAYIVQIDQDFFTLAGIATILNFSTEENFIHVLVSLLMACNIIYIACFTYCWCYNSKRKDSKYEGPWKVLNTLHSCFFWVVLLPVFHISFRALYLLINLRITQGTATKVTYVMLVFSLLNIITALFIFFNTAYFYNEIKVDETDMLAGANDDFKIICGTIKIITLMIRHFLIGSDPFGLILCLETLNHLTMIVLVYFTRVVYNESINKLLAIMASLTFVLTISSALFLVSDDLQNYNPILMTFLIAPVVAKALLTLKSRKDAVPSKYYGKDIKSSKEAYYYISFLLHKTVHRSFSRSEYEMILTSVYIHHEMNCEKNECFCSQPPKLKKQRYDNASTLVNSWSFEVFEAKMLSYIENLFHYFLKKHPNSPHLNLAFSNFLIRYLDNIPKSIYYLSCSQNHTQGLKFNYYIFKTMNEIQNYMQLFNSDNNDSTNQLKLVKALQISHRYEQLLDLFETALKRNIEFFEVLCEDKSDKEGIFSKIAKSHEANRNFERHFRELYLTCSKQMGSLFVYGLYNLVILNKTEAYEYLRVAERIKYNMIKFESDNKIFKKLEQVVSSDPGLIVISGERERLGTIQYISQSLVTMLGYSHSELLTQKVDKIIPITIAQFHNRYMRRFESHGNSTIFHAMRRMFAKHTNGHIIPVYLLVKPIFSIEKGMQYLGMLKEIKEPNNHILTDRLGYIDSMTLDLMQKLKIDKILLNSNSFKVDHFIKGVRHYYDKLNEKLNSIPQSEIIKEQASFMYTFETSTIFNEKTIRKLVEKIKRSTQNKFLPDAKPKKNPLLEKFSFLKDSSKGSDSSSTSNVHTLFKIHASPTSPKKARVENRTNFSNQKTAASFMSFEAGGAPMISNANLDSRISFANQSLSVMQAKGANDPGHSTKFSIPSNHQLSPVHRQHTNQNLNNTHTSQRRQTSFFSAADFPLGLYARSSRDVQEFSCTVKLEKIPLLQNTEVFIIVEINDLYIDKKNVTAEISLLNTMALKNASYSGNSRRGLSSTVDFDNHERRLHKDGMQPNQSSKISSSNDIAVRHQYINNCLEQFKSTNVEKLGYYTASSLALLSVLFQILFLISIYDFNSHVDQNSLYVDLFYPSQTFTFEMAASSYLLEFVNATTTSLELSTVPEFSSEVYTDFFTNLALFMTTVVNETQTFIDSLILQPDVYNTRSFLNIYAKEISISLFNQSTTLQLLEYFSLMIGSSLRVINLNNSTSLNSSIAQLLMVTDNLVMNDTALSALQDSSDQLEQILNLSANQAYFILNIILTSLFAVLVLFLTQRSIKVVNMTYNSIYWLRNFNNVFYESRRSILTNFQVLKSEINQVHSSFEPQILAINHQADDLNEQKARHSNSGLNSTQRTKATKTNMKFLRTDSPKACFWILLYLAGNITVIVLLQRALNNYSSNISLYLSLENDFSEERFYGTELLTRQLYMIEQTQLYGSNWESSTAMSEMQKSFDSFMAKSASNDLLTAQILTASQLYADLYQGNFCELFFQNGTVLIDYCNQIFGGVASRGYPAFKSRLIDYLVLQQNQIIAGSFDYEVNTTRINIIDIFASYFYIDKNLKTFLTQQLNTESNADERSNKILNLVLVIILIVSTIVYWFAYFINRKMITKKALMVKKALRFFSDEAILSNKRVVVQICKTSNYEVSRILRR